MKGIDKIYCNEIGISFFWKTKEVVPNAKIQLIFRDMGFLLTLEELKSFAGACETVVTDHNCKACKLADTCRSLLLKTPSEKIDIAVNSSELKQISDLLGTTILKVEVRSWISNSRN